MPLAGLSDPFLKIHIKHDYELDVSLFFFIIINFYLFYKIKKKKNFSSNNSKTRSKYFSESFFITIKLSCYLRLF